MKHNNRHTSEVDREKQKPNIKNRILSLKHI